MKKKELYMEGFYNTLSMLFLDDIGLIKKQNRDQLVGRVCTTIALNSIISSGEWDHDTEKHVLVYTKIAFRNNFD